MTAKKFLLKKEAREALARGVEKLATIVATTLSPKGRNVGLDRKFRAPAILHDGVKIAEEINLEDPFEDMGAQLVKEAAKKTVGEVGDGTTTSIVLANTITQEGIKALNKEVNPMTLKKGIDKAVAIVAEELKRISKPVKKSEEIEQVATIASADPTVGKLIAEILKRLGHKDVVMVAEEGKGTATAVEYKEGMEFDKGFVSSHFITNPDKSEVEIESPYILLTDHRLATPNDIFTILDLLEKQADGAKEIVIIADRVEGDALNTLIINKHRGSLSPLVVTAPAFAETRNSLLEDIATLTGGKFISREMGMKLDKITLSDFGRADKVWSNNSSTKIIGGKGSAIAVKERVAQIRNEIERTDSDFEKEKLQERLAKLTSGVAVVKVGAMSEAEMEEKKARVDDAIGATKAAVLEGIVVGGGIALFRARDKLKEIVGKTRDETEGIRLVYKALVVPLETILKNAGLEESEETIKKILESENPNFGYNVDEETFGDLMEMGVVDPTRVVRTALENAASVSSMILTTDALVAEFSEEKKQALSDA